MSIVSILTFGTYFRLLTSSRRWLADEETEQCIPGGVSDTISSTEPSLNLALSKAALALKVQVGNEEKGALVVDALQEPLSILAPPRWRGLVRSSRFSSGAT
eukprot:845271-Pyramimonas_sp.AAC.1